MPEAAASIRITLPDGGVREVPPGITPMELARSLGSRLAKDAVVARVNGHLVDLTRPIREDAQVRILTHRDPEALGVLRHSTAHATAQAVQELFPGTKIGQGPVIENGFYYDFDREQPFSEDDLQAIEARVQEIIQRDLPIERTEIPKEKAIEFFTREEEPYKIHFAKTKGGSTVSVYRQGDWSDFCLGPHLPSTGKLRCFKLLSVAGAYWLGDEKNKMLQRIYGTAFFTQKELDAYLELLEKARKRDHRKLGKELGLFSFHPEAPASPFFLPKGAAVYNLLVDYVRRLYVRYGYTEVITPQIFDSSLWKTSGHYDHFAENMYFTEVDKREYGVKPMNCPSHCLIYSEGRHSYRDLPMRLADFGRLHRYEPSGATAGLTRVRTFAQDDGHIYCTPEQVPSEVESTVRMILECYELYGFPKVEIFLSTRPDNRAGTDDQWDRSEESLEAALKDSGHAYTIHPGEGAFYGPKIDFIVEDALGREHQLGTIQLDYVLPERFRLRYLDSQDREQRPAMIHRAMLGSIERFMGILIEHYGGAFPFWLAPVQIRLLSVTERAAAYAGRLRERLTGEGFRAQADLRNEKIGAKIRQAQLEKIPCMLIVGDREEKDGTVAVRSREGGDLGGQPVEEFVDRARALVEQHKGL